jgi:hypothetical protein
MESGRTVIAGTQYGDVRINKTCVGFCAEFVTEDNRKVTAFHPVPSVALQQLGEKIRRVLGH